MKDYLQNVSDWLTEHKDKKDLHHPFHPGHNHPHPGHNSATDESVHNPYANHPPQQQSAGFSSKAPDNYGPLSGLFGANPNAG